MDTHGRLMVLKKNKADTTTLFIDASEECIKVTNNNRLKDFFNRIFGISSYKHKESNR